MRKLDWQRVQWIIDQALAEDIGEGDLTSITVLHSDHQSEAKIISKDSGVIAGLPIAERVFETRDAGLQVEPVQRDGETVESGDTIMRIRGSGRSILAAERTALNILGRCSGIATQTDKFVRAVAEYPTKILDTRKTAPLLRELDKYAVRAGGGENHRYGLFDMILIKENHIRWAGGIQPALQNVLLAQRESKQTMKVEIEVANLTELEQAMRFEVDRIMLDNFTLDQIRQAVVIAGNKVELEASGGIRLDTVKQIAATGVHYISVGSLTHSVKNFDLSLLFV